MELIGKEISELSKELLQYPEILASRDFVWEKLRSLDEPAPLGFLINFSGIQVQREYTEGVPLRPRAGGQLKYILRAIDRLSTCEAVGILHGDLKTEHILLRPDGSVRWIDWDFAINRNEGAGGEWGIGTPGFIAPEKIRTGVTSVATEIFSLGKILQEQQEYYSISRVRELADRCTAIDISRRPQSFHEVYSALEALL